MANISNGAQHAAGEQNQRAQHRTRCRGAVAGLRHETDLLAAGEQLTLRGVCDGGRELLVSMRGAHRWLDGKTSFSRGRAKKAYNFLRTCEDDLDFPTRPKTDFDVPRRPKTDVDFPRRPKTDVALPCNSMPRGTTALRVARQRVV